MLEVFLLLVLLPASVIIACSLLVGIRNARQLATSQLESVAAIRQGDITNLLEQMHSYLANTLVGPIAYSSSVLLLERKGQGEQTKEASSYARNRFLAALSVSDLFQELMLVARDGKVVLSTIPGNEGASFSPRLLRLGSNGASARIEGGAILALIPVRNRAGDTLGVMCGRGSLEKLNRMMQEASGLGETGESYLIDGGGYLVTPSRFKGYAVGVKLSSKGVEEVLKSHAAGSGLYRDYRGVPVLGVYRWLPELELAVFTERDQSEVFSPIETGAGISLAVAFVALLLAAIASARYSRAITAPIAELAGIATRVAAGDLGLTAKVERKDEIGTLAHAFNSMTGQLSELIAKLRASETKYRIIADNTYGWEFWRSPDGRFLYVSPSCERISGYKPAQFYADQDLILRIVHEEDRPAVAAHQEAALPGAASFKEMEFRIIAADGSLRWIGHVCSSVWDDSGNFLGKRGTNRDITEAKKTEAELLEAKEQAEAGNRAKSAFISSMSHELRTPLNAIIGYTQVLSQDETLTPSQQNQLAALRKSGDHLLSLINDILDAGMIESGRIRLEEGVFDLPSLLRQILTDTKQKASAKGLQFRCDFPGPVPAQIRGDKSKLEKILLALLDNAVRYTSEGSVQLRFDYDRSGAGSVRFEVVDTGIGIAAEKLEQVFEPFTQLGREGLVQEGTGLGLTVAHRLVALMLGKMEVKSEPGKGSSFKVVLPLPAVGEEYVEMASQLESAAEQAALAATEPVEWEMPPPEKLAELFELAILGDMRKISLWAGNLMEIDSRYDGFAKQVRELAEGFKSKAIMALVEKHLPGREQ